MAAKITVVGDWNGWDPKKEDLVLVNPKGTLALFHTEFPIDARYAYRFLLEGKASVNDPLNHFVEQEVFGANTAVRMPAYINPEYGAEEEHALEGQLRELVVPGNAKGQFGRPVKVYTPKGVKRSGKLPILYIHDGIEVRTVGKFLQVLENLYSHEPLTPHAAFVFVPPVERNKEYMLNASFARWFAMTLVPSVEKQLRLQASAETRGVTGASLGGLLSAQLGYLYPKVFGNIAAQSPSFWVKDCEMIRLFHTVRQLPLRWYLHTGVVNDAEQETRRMLAVLSEKGYDITYRETHESHNWANWRGKYAEIVRWFLQSQK